MSKKVVTTKRAEFEARVLSYPGGINGLSRDTGLSTNAIREFSKVHHARAPVHTIEAVAEAAGWLERDDPMTLWGTTDWRSAWEEARRT